MKKERKMRKARRNVVESSILFILTLYLVRQSWLYLVRVQDKFYKNAA